MLKCTVYSMLLLVCTVGPTRAPVSGSVLRSLCYVVEDQFCYLCHVFLPPILWKLMKHVHVYLFPYIFESQIASLAMYLLHAALMV